MALQFLDVRGKQMVSKEPIRHHYIPQFILKNFCFDTDRTQLLYFDKRTSTISIKQPRDIFMVKNLYRDDINNSDDIMKIEKDMARFESETAKIIAEKVLKKDEIILTVDEDERLKLFFAIMALRSKSTSKMFSTEVSGKNKAFYSIYQKNGNFDEFWKRNLGNLINCRSMREVCEHKKIDAPIKAFFLRDTYGLTGLYFAVAERRGPLEFLISDVYPTLITGTTVWGAELHMYSICPISPDRIILLVSNGVLGVPQNVVGLRDEVLKKPKLSLDRRTITIRVKIIYENEVRYVNDALINAAYEGLAFKNKSKVTFPHKV